MWQVELTYSTCVMIGYVIRVYIVSVATQYWSFDIYILKYTYVTVLHGAKLEIPSFTRGKKQLAIYGSDAILTTSFKSQDLCRKDY